MRNPNYVTALDMGTTAVKAGVFTRRGNCVSLFSKNAPKILKQGAQCISDPQGYIRTVFYLLKKIHSFSGKEEISLGISAQRSSFLIWQRSDGKPVTPLISWQDLRAVKWCDKKKSNFPDSFFRKRTGLFLNPYYFAPKLALLLETDKALRKRAQRGELVAGTIDTWLLWHLTGGKTLYMCKTVAARTLLTEVSSGEWSKELLDVFNIPRDLLPDIEPQVDLNHTQFKGLKITCCIADQAAPLIRLRAPIINLGTGGFVLIPKQKMDACDNSFLWSRCGNMQYPQFCQEGCINGIAAAVSNYSKNITNKVITEEMFTSSGVFCLPDTSGLGSPWWVPKIKMRFSKTCRTENESVRAVLEGIVFRIKSICDCAFPSTEPPPFYLSGGLSNIPFIPRFLADCLGVKIKLITAGELTLKSTALLAFKEAGILRTPEPHISYSPCRKKAYSDYVKSKYAGWLDWIKRQIRIKIR